MKINRFIALTVIALLVVGAMGFIATRGLALGSNNHQQQALSTQVPDTGEASDPNEVQSVIDTDNIEEQVGDQVSDKNMPEAASSGAGVQASAPAASVAASSQVSVPATKLTGIVSTSAQTTSITETAPVVDPTTNITDTTNVNEQTGNQVEDGQPDVTEMNSEASGTGEAANAPDSGVQDPSYNSSIAVDQSQASGLSEADESAALQSKATISAAEAEVAVMAANPGTKVVKTELDNENGALVYSVELSNGADVKVDAGNGTILYTDNGADGEQ